ncbi:hypothetical protein CYMTET_18465 [Cymbomonas tetramitiformis]|uniref:CRAL-TRIO domain-containing protein n=1 Tax=Cymbomonas tetramitiformis TaxID=36881 RepID=A0AAE0L655_9CHLO|nr:hypothetical protein CYMTET_18465 [Cymbomonas tetramitiformis]
MGSCIGPGSTLWAGQGEALKANVTDIGDSKVLFKSGVDFEQRPIVVMVGAHLDPLVRSGDLERFLLFAVREMQPIVASTYTMVYMHAEVGNNSGLSLDFVRQLHAALDPKHKDTLKAFYVVHPTMMLKMATSGMAMLGAGISRRVWRKAIYIDKLDDLFACISPEQLYIPDFVWDHDRSLTNM